MTVPDITPVDADTAIRGPIEIKINVAYKGRTYRPDACPAHLYLEPEPNDHARACPAGPRTSSFGPAEPGPCNCNVRCFPAAPAVVACVEIPAAGA